MVQIIHFILLLSLNITIAYKFSVILLNFNDAITYCHETYNSSLATIFSSKQIEIVSNLCELNGITNCWVELMKKNNTNINTYWKQYDEQYFGNDYCIEITKNINETRNQLNKIPCNVLRHPICNDEATNELLDEHYERDEYSNKRKLLQPHTISCSSVNEDTSTCYIALSYDNKTVICDPAYSNCNVTFSATYMNYVTINCPSGICTKCIINTKSRYLTYSSIHGHNCRLVQIINAVISDSRIYAPNNGSLLIDSSHSFWGNKIYSSRNEPGTQNILINLGGPLGSYYNYIDASNITGILNYSCTGTSSCDHTQIICGDMCNIYCSSIGIGACYNMSVYGSNGTSNVHWYCKNDLSRTCLAAQLECGVDLISPLNFDYMSRDWYYGTTDCIIPKDSIPIPPLSCTMTTSDTCIIARTNKYFSRDVICDPKYKYCVIQATTELSYDFVPTVFECPNKICDSCKIHCDGHGSCSGATIKGYNCTTLEIHIRSSQSDITIYAPGNHGELAMFTQSTDRNAAITQSYVLSVPGTKNMVFNFGECWRCTYNMFDGSHVTEYMNVSCNEFAYCQGNKIICPNDANCNIDCTSNRMTACKDIMVNALEGTHDVNWWCNDDDVKSCVGSKLFCDQSLLNFSKFEELWPYSTSQMQYQYNFSQIQYDEGKWRFDNKSNVCVDIPTIAPTLSPTVSPSPAPTPYPTGMPTVTEMLGLNKLEWIATGIGLAVIVLLIFVGLIYYFKYYKPEQKSLYISNCLVLVIGIGIYDDESDDHEIAAVLDNLLCTQRDIYYMVDLFNTKLNYEIYPKKLVTDTKNNNDPKQYWTEQELKTFLTDRAKYLESNIDNGKKYDGLFVLVSGHGLPGYICTSDYKRFSKVKIHRIFSSDHPKSRQIPRIFLFDSCSGNAEQEIPEVINSDEKSKQVEAGNDVGTWWRGDDNPDYRLATIDASNYGFQAKARNDMGSYVVHGFYEKCMNILKRKRLKFLHEVFDEIQHELNARGKQFPIHVLNGDTKYIRFKRNSAEILDETKINDISNKEWKMEELEQKNDTGNVEMMIQCSDEKLDTIDKLRKTKSFDGNMYANVEKYSDDDNDNVQCGKGSKLDNTYELQQWNMSIVSNGNINEYEDVKIDCDYKNKKIILKYNQDISQTVLIKDSFSIERDGEVVNIKLISNGVLVKIDCKSVKAAKYWLKKIEKLSRKIN